MKKQIFILVMAFLAISTNSVFGQKAQNNTDINTFSCTNDALHPMAGKEYHYNVNPNPAGGNFTWWATTNTNFITSGGIVNSGAGLITSPNVVVSGTTPYNTSSNLASANDITLTWSTSTLATAMASTPTFVSVHYDAPAGCTDNLKVYQIEPINGFVVDITNVDHTNLSSKAYLVAESQCFAPIMSATWVANAMTYNYGTNVLFYEVIAANFTGSWTPTFNITGLQTGQTATIDWAYTTAFGGAVNVATNQTNGTYSNATIAETLSPNTSLGVSIYVRVTVNNNAFEGTNSYPITLAVTGRNSANQSDVKNNDCNTTSVFADNSAVQTLNERPVVGDNTNVGTFEL